MDAQELLKLKDRHANGCDCDNETFGKLIALAERAVSPAESVPDLSDLLNDLYEAGFDSPSRHESTPDYRAARDAIKARIAELRAASHAEGRRSAMEELAKEKERADRAEAKIKADDEAARLMFDDLRKARDEQAQRADAAIAGCKRWCGDGECKDACVDRDAHPSDNLQQASGGIVGTGVIDDTAYVQASMNKQQASTAQVEPAKMECPTCGADRLKERCKAEHWQQCPMTGEAQATPIDRNAVAAVQQKLDSMTVYGKPNAQATPEGADLPEELKAIIELYADSYRSMSKMGDGKVDAGNVEYDMTANIIPQIMKAARAALAAQQNSASNSSNNSATTAAEPVYQAAAPGGSWKDVHKDMLATFESLNYPTRILYRAAPPQQVDTNGLPE